MDLCSHCKGELLEMGALGYRKHHRCRGCGAQFSQTVSKPQIWHYRKPTGRYTYCTGRSGSNLLLTTDPKEVDCKACLKRMAKDGVTNG